MDTLTHALSGALLARATAAKDAPPGSIPRRIAAGFFACAAPDLDFVAGFAGPVEYLLNHRGITHSLVLLPVWALGVAWLLAKMLREPGGWRALYAITSLSIGAHIAADVITSYGTMVLAPFSDWRAGIGTTFIIDLWFTGIIVAGLIASAIGYRSRWPAVGALAILVAYVGFQYLQREHALEFAARHARPGTHIDAQPRPVSPFNWTVFVSDDEAHEFAHINLVRAVPRRYQPGDGFIARIDSPYMPVDKAIWVRRMRYGEVNTEIGKEAWNAPALGFFRWFAAQPAFDGTSDGGSCVWFVDLRFVTPGRDLTPFQFGACRESGTWRGYERAGPASKILLR
ncbi:MAG TPA: metal-dependent hydrolase [Burkholderiales bacterium]